MTMGMQQTWYDLLLQKWSDLIITLVGVFLGAFLAYRIESARTKRQESRERLAEGHRNRQHLQAFLDRVKFELRNNEQTVTQILEKLDRTEEARVDLFQWIAALGKALAVVAYDDLSRSGLQSLLPESLQSDLFDARQRTLGFQSMLEAAEPAAKFYFGYGGGQPAADKVRQNLRTYGDTARDGITRAKDAAFAEVSRLKQQP